MDSTVFVMLLLAWLAVAIALACAFGLFVAYRAGGAECDESCEEERT